MTDIKGLELVDIRSYTDVPIGFRFLIALIVCILLINAFISLYMIYTNFKEGNTLKAIGFATLLIVGSFAGLTIISDIEKQYTYPEYVYHIVGTVDTDTLYANYTTISNHGDTVVLHPIQED